MYEAKKAGRNQAVGMLPSREEPASDNGATTGGKPDRLSEMLAAQTIVTPGPVRGADAKDPGGVKVLSATQGS